jgi:outer membrane protein OmpA-like peptidoglycan-associated protein
MDRWGIPLAGLLLFCGLCWYCIEREPDSIAQDLTARTVIALQSAGIEIPPNGLRVDGQSVIVSGPRGSAIVSEDARRRLEAVWGVTEVIVNAREVPGPPPVQAASVTGTVIPASAPVAVPPGVANQLQSEFTRILQGKTVRFVTNSDVLLPDGKRLLDEIAKALSATPVVPVEISAHTDSDGDAQKNLDLSKRRAASVKKYLVSKGIPESRLIDSGFGATKPIGPNDTREAKARNRRVDFHAQGSTEPSPANQ